MAITRLPVAKIPMPPALKVSSASAATSGLVVPEPPAWVKGDREVAIDGVAHYVIKTGSREIFYRKRDIALSRETVNGAVVVLWTPSRVGYV
jgi:hypothetical protein